MNLDEAMLAASQEVMQECRRAQVRFAPFNSAHEGFAVLKEEVDELWDEVKKNRSKRCKRLMRVEAMQVAAMAVRFMSELCTDDFETDPQA